MLKISPEALVVIRDCVRLLNESQRKSPESAHAIAKLRASLRNGLLRLHQYACHRDDAPGYDLSKTQCDLHGDWAPLSFAFCVHKIVGGEKKYWFNGGLIFHGSHDGFGDGGAETLSVCVSPTNGWSIHT